ncbi:MAG: hypothetical protein LQ338_002381 [Usnochroma carphineum]|nr:MAG: hypothetical protein LQ338_002381 [Usnochroma carphineum]
MKTSIPNWLDQDPQEPLSAIEYSNFGKLPAELRLRIYDYLAQPGTLHVWRQQNRLFHSFCYENPLDLRSFGPTGTLKRLVANGKFNQDQVVKEAGYHHNACSMDRNNPTRRRASFSLFHTCRLIYMEARPLIDKMYSTAIFYFINTPALERFVDIISPYSKSLLQHIHLTLPVSRWYGGVRRPLVHTLHHLQPNPYKSNFPLPRHISDQQPRLRLRIKFLQYQSDRGFDVNVSPSISLFFTRLPAFLFRTILVIVPALPIPPSPPSLGANALTTTVKQAPNWYTKLVPSHHLDCLAEIVASVMEARYEIRIAEQQGTLGPHQWLCGDMHGRRDKGWWVRGGEGEGEGEGEGVRKDIEIKLTVVFGV